MRNYNDMLRQLSTEEAARLKKKENDAVEKSITDPAVLNENLMDNFMKAREGIVTQDEVKRKQMIYLMTQKNKLFFWKTLDFMRKKS